MHAWVIQDDMLVCSEPQRIRYQQTANIVVPATNSIRYAVIYYSSMVNVDHLLLTYQDRRYGRACHLVLDTYGNVVQFASLRTVLTHTRRADEAVNFHSIGIELINRGPLIADNRSGKYKDMYGNTVPTKRIHFDRIGNPWERFTGVQLNTIHEILDTVKAYYGCQVVGYRQIDHTAYDPGPGFPQEMLQPGPVSFDFVSGKIS